MPNMYPHGSGNFPALRFDPAPGQSASVNALADDLNNTHANLKAARDALTAIINGTGGWTGVAADAFTSKIKALPKLLDSATDSFRRSMTSLGNWHDELQMMQVRAAEYEGQAENARRNIDHANSDPAFKLVGQTFPSQAEADRAQRRIDGAAARLESAQQDLDTIINNARKLLDHHDELACAVARQVQQACDEAPDEPGMWDRLIDGINDLVEGYAESANEVWDWIKDHANAISAIGDVLSTLSMVTGLVGLACDATGVGALIGGPLGLVSGGLAAAALVVHGTAKAAGADVSNRTLAEDALGAVTLGIGGSGLKALGATERIIADVGRTGDAAGAVGTIDSVAASIQDSTVLSYFIPKNERQVAELSLGLATGGASALAVPFENAWKAGSEKDKAND